MDFVNLTPEEFKEFEKDYPNRNFLQSYNWSIFCEQNKHKKIVYVGLKENNKVIAATSIHLTRLPLGYFYGYSPRGFLIDYNDNKLFTTFTNKLKDYLKQNKIVFLTVDPDLYYEEVDTDANVVKNGFNNYELFNEFIKLGYKHKGFNKLYESNQPRYSFIIPYENLTFDEVIKKLNKNYRKGINKAKSFDLEVEIGTIDDIDTFYNLMYGTSLKDHFNAYSKSYYKNFYEIFSKDKEVIMFNGVVRPKELLKHLDNVLKTTTDESQIEKTKKLIEKYSQIKEDKIITNSHIMVMYKNHATALYAGNNLEYNDICINNLMYYEKLKTTYDMGAKDLDLFGVCGDPNTKYKNLAGIYDFKKKFGGYLVEYFGDFDLYSNKILYKLIKCLLSIYHFLIRIKLRVKKLLKR